MEPKLNLKHKKSEKGFTLVELAIVMIIIGLLIVGILKGQEMIANAQVTATVSQIKGIDAATSTFRDMYDALPGDMINVGDRLPNCEGNNCDGDGNGNGRIDGDPGDAVTFNSERRRFFTHLAAADLVTGISSIPQDTTVNFGEDLPATERGGAGYTVGYVASGTPTSMFAPAPPGGHYLGITNDPTSAMSTTNVGLTPSQAARIDRKLDDGAPNTGSVRAGGAAGATGCAGSGVSGIYQEAEDQLRCNLFLRIQG